ncbi:MAG: complex I NDUFA9 subunit family protein [Alphaproteobacteria bacterium]|nr:complex I NDUFA9 subunit family protein [Alphaproteobacteria bacterium]
MSYKRVAIIGGSGFIGRHLVRRLAADDCIVRVCVRDPEAALFLKPMGAVGQIVPIQTNLRDDASVRAAVAGVDAVVNLVGILHEFGKQTFDAIHAEGAGRVAAAAAEAGVGRLVHMSALGADAGSPAQYGRSKAAGEAAVKAAFPGATIVRPSIVFGPEDNFFNRFAAMAVLSPALPLIGGGGTRFQPVYVGDVAEAVRRVLADPSAAGRTYELGGPEVYSFRELLALLLEAIGRRRILLPVPAWAAAIPASVLERLPVPPLTRDQIRLLERDNVPTGTAPGLADLAIPPTAVMAVLPTYLDRFRVRGRFAGRQRDGAA